MHERVYHGRKFDSVDQLKQAIVLEWCALPRRFIDHSVGNGNVVCSVTWIRMAVTLKLNSTLSVL